MSGDYHSVISHRVWQKHHLLPQDLWEMDPYHKAFIYASEFVQIEADKKMEREARRK